MPTNRTLINRHRRPAITREVVDLFRRLDSTPARLRGRQEFKDAAHELMRRLDLVSEFWTMSSVLDRSSGPCHPEGYAAHKDWHTCRRVRQALLEAIKSEPAKPEEGNRLSGL